MKVPPKRKGNLVAVPLYPPRESLNESPSEKEGKFEPPAFGLTIFTASMKVPPKRKGNP